jgi:hypothetical protein
MIKRSNGLNLPKNAQMFPEYDKYKLPNVGTGDETWILYFEPVRKQSNTISETRNCKIPKIAKLTLSAKKVLYAMFFSINLKGVAIQAPVKRGKKIIWKYYRDVVLKKLRTCYQKRRPVSGFKHVRLLLNNAPAHTSAIVSNFYNKSKSLFSLIPHIL